MLRTTWVPIGDGQIHYAEAPGSSVPVVFVHGFTGSLESYLPIIAALSPPVHAYVLDWRGHGRSSHGRSTYLLRDHVADLRAFLVDIVGRPALVAGHSMGGMAAAWLAAEAPELVLGLVIEDAPLYGGVSSDYTGFFQQLHDLLQAHKTRGSAEDDLAALIGAWEFDPGLTRRAVFGDAGVRLHARQWLQMDLAHFASIVSGEVRAGYDPAAVLAAIRCPCHLITCPDAQGAALPSSDVTRALAEIADCTHALIPDVSHRIHELNPEAYAAQVRFVLEQRLPSGS